MIFREDFPPHVIESLLFQVYIPMSDVNRPQLRVDRLPKSITQLPDSILKQILESEELLKGLASSLEETQHFSKAIDMQLKQQKERLEESLAMYEDYDGVSEDIRAKMQHLRNVYGEFVNLETYQYQLLSANFNNGYLKNKFAKSVDASHLESMDVARQLSSLPDDSPDSHFAKLLRDFKDARKTYHLKREKLNRWDEDRVSGFI